MRICIATIKPKTDHKDIRSRLRLEEDNSLICHYGHYGSTRISMLQKYQAMWETSKPEHEYLAYIHDDVTIHEQSWQTRVETEFADPRVAIVGLGGANGLGVDDIYKTPYQLQQLQRIDYYSNQSDWEIHGKHETGSRQVATVDGFCMVIRTAFLNEIGGWTWMKTNFHNYDNAMCLMAARRGWKVRIVGVECTHHGGGTSTSAEYMEWCRKNFTTPEREHEAPHEWLYSEFRDMLPLRI